MQKSEFTLKGHKQLQGMDGYVYDGILLHNGKPLLRYHDGGHGGGMILQFFDRAREPEFEAFIKSLPHYDCSELYGDGKVHTSEHSADTFIEEIILDQEMKKKLLRAAKTKTVFRLKGDSEGSFRSVTGGPFSEASKAWLVKKFGDKLETIFDQNGKAVA